MMPAKTTPTPNWAAVDRNGVAVAFSTCAEYVSQSASTCRSRRPPTEAATGQISVETCLFVEDVEKYVERIPQSEQQPEEERLLQRLFVILWRLGGSRRRCRAGCDSRPTPNWLAPCCQDATTRTRTISPLLRHSGGRYS